MKIYTLMCHEDHRLLSLFAVCIYFSPYRMVFILGLIVTKIQECMCKRVFNGNQIGSYRGKKSLKISTAKDTSIAHM